MTEAEALEVARKAAIDQIQKLARALEEQQPSTVFDGAGQRRMIIEAGMLLASLLNEEETARRKAVAENMRVLARRGQH